MRISVWSSDVCSSDLFFIVAQHRHDDDLVRRDARRTAQAVVIAVGHDDGADGARRKAPTDGMAEAVAAVLVLEADIRGLGETGAQIVRRSRLQRLAVLHLLFDRIVPDGDGTTLRPNE